MENAKIKSKRQQQQRIDYEKWRRKLLAWGKVLEYKNRERKKRKQFSQLEEKEGSRRGLHQPRYPCFQEEGHLPGVKRRRGGIASTEKKSQSIGKGLKGKDKKGNLYREGRTRAKRLK